MECFSPKAQESEIEILSSVQKKEILSLSLTNTCLTSPSSHHSIKYLYNIYIKYKRLYNNIKYLHLTNASRSAPRVKLIGYQFSSVAQSCLTLCNPMNRSTPGLPVHHQLPGFTQTHVHWVGDTSQSSHSLLSPSPPAFNLSQHQCLFKWVSSLHEVAKILEFQLQHQSFQ